MFRKRPRVPRSGFHRQSRRPLDIPRHANTRYFARNSQLLLLAPRTTRPQPSFLIPSSAQQLHRGQWQLNRLLTTERRARFKYESKVLLGHIIICIAATFTFVIVTHSLLEESKPSPREWSLWSRMKWQRAHAYRDKKVQGGNMPTYIDLETIYRQLLERLEDPEIDGGGLVRQGGAGTDNSVEVNTGLDISGKSAEWRHGYYECLLRYAEACEHVQEWVRDKETGQATPKAYVVGPSNPNPAPGPPIADLLGIKPPKEEDSKPAAPPPETIYVKILTTGGFTVKQRVDAAVAYGDWLDFKGFHDSAEEVYRWGLDIAMSGVTEPESMIDPATAIVKAGPTIASENVLTAASALATHFASTAEPTAALPIYLSVLRARRAAPKIDPKSLETVAVNRPDESAWSWILRQLEEKPFPLPPLSGNEPFSRHHGGIDECDDAKIMGYIGEILFATSNDEKGKADAIRWTKDAIDSANSGLRAKEMTVDEKVRCVDCRQVELDNLLAMTKRLAVAEREQREEPPPTRWARWWAPVPPNSFDWHQEWTDATRRHHENGLEDLRSKLTITPTGNLWSYARRFVFV